MNKCTLRVKTGTYDENVTENDLPYTCQNGALKRISANSGEQTNRDNGSKKTPFLMSDEGFEPSTC